VRPCSTVLAITMESAVAKPRARLRAIAGGSARRSAKTHTAAPLMTALATATVALARTAPRLAATSEALKAPSADDASSHESSAGPTASIPPAAAGMSCRYGRARSADETERTSSQRTTGSPRMHLIPSRIDRRSATPARGVGNGGSALRAAALTR